MKIKSILSAILLIIMFTASYADAAVYMDGKISVSTDLSDIDGEKTIVVYPKSKAGEEISAEDIIYIDQDDSSFKNINLKSGNLENGEYGVNINSADERRIEETLVKLGSAEDVSNVALSCGNLFYTFNGNENVNFKLSWNNNNTVNKSINVVVTDYFGNMAYGDSATVSGETEYAINIPGLKYGNFKLTVNFCDNTYEKAFAVTKPENERNNSEENIAALSTMAYCTGIEHISNENIEEYVKTVAYAGVKHVREAAVTKSINPSVGVYEYPERLDKLLAAYKKYGIKTILMFQEMPEYMLDSGDFLPTDMRLVYEAFYNIIDHYKDYIAAVEIYNEPENERCGADSESPDKYAAFAKTVAVAAADVGVKSINAAIGTNAYRKTAFENFMSEYIVAYNDHKYINADENKAFSSYDMGGVNIGFVKDAEEYGNSEVIMTETGLRIQPEDGKTELNCEQQKYQARTAIASFLEGAESGFERLYWFRHGYYYETPNLFSTMTAGREPYYVYGALSAFTDTVGNGAYAGKLSGVPENVINACFKDGNRYISCFMSENEYTQSLKIDAETAVSVDIMGNSTTLNAENGYITFKVSADPVYIIMSSSPELSEKAELKVKQEKGVPTFTDAQKIVMNQRFENYNGELLRIGDARQLSTDKDNKMYLDVFNLNSEEITAVIKPKTFGGWQCVGEAGSVTVPAKGKITLEFIIRAGDLAAGDFTSNLVFDCITDNGVSSSASLIRAIPSSEKAYIIEGLGNPSKWNNAGEKSSEKIDENTIKFNFKWSKSGDNVSQPNITIPDNVNISKYGGMVMQCKADQTVDKMLLIMAVNQNGNMYMVQKPNMTVTDEYMTVIFDWSNMKPYSKDVTEPFDPAKADKSTIRIGFSNFSDVTTMSCWYKNVSFYEKTDLTEPTAESIEYNNGILTLKMGKTDIGLKQIGLSGEVDGEKISGRVDGGNAVFSLPLKQGSHTFKLKTYTEANGIADINREFTSVGYGLKKEMIQIVPNGDAASINMNINNYYASKCNAVVYAAAYDKDGRLTEITAKKVEIQPDNFVKYAETLNIKNAKKIKLFIWKDDGSAEPLETSHEVSDY